jgi:O-antigen ligase
MSISAKTFPDRLSTAEVGSAAAGTAANRAAVSTNPRLLWLAILVVGAAFFFVAHDFQVSRYERFAPWSDAEEGTLEAGRNMAKGLALSMIGLLGLYFILRQNGRPLRPTGWLPALMLLYLVWSMASVLWSIDPGMSCRRLAVLTFCGLGALGFARQFRPRDLAVMAMTIAAAYLLVGVCVELALGTFCPWSPGYRFAGTVHPNTQGAHLAVLCLASFSLARSATRGRGWLSALLAVGLVFLLLTKSRTSCAGLAMALATLWLASVSGRARALAVTAAGFTICATALAGSLLGGNVDDKVAEIVMLGRQNESEGLSGRIPLWAELADYIRVRPLQGYGYESFWIARHVEAISDHMQWPLREAHNAYIDGVLSVGVIGLGTMLAIVWFALRRAAVAFRGTADPGFALTFCLLVFGLVSACLETGMMSANFITLMAGSGIVQLAILRENRETAGSGCATTSITP